MLALEVTFLTGRYVATAFDDRDEPEWPPHPARLFSALVATHFEAPDRSDDERTLLEWLECQSPPCITAPNEARREVVQVFVPVNDTTVVGSFDDEWNARARERAELAAFVGEGKAKSAIEKRVQKMDKRFADAVRKAIAPVAAGKEPKDAIKKAAMLLPDGRLRQARTFPSVAGRDMECDLRVVFAWPDAELPPARRTVLDQLAARVVRIGHSSSLVSVRVRDDAPPPTWVPNDEAVSGADLTLRVVGSGQIEALCDAFERQADAPGRVMPAAFQRYAPPRQEVGVRAGETTFGEDWIVLRRIAGPRFPSLRAADIARTLRKALLAAHGPNAPEILSGHRAPDEPSAQPHLAYVPLPNVGHEHADGAILGVALVLPRVATNSERQSVYGALAAWERAKRSAADDELPALPLYVSHRDPLHLVRVEGDATQSTLRAASWCQPARRWASATPIALDRNPGDLRSHDAAKEAAAYREAEAIVAAACTRIGLPAPERVTVLAASPLAGGEKARHFPAYRTGPLQRVLVHATLEFAMPVRGPILLGAGRYFGMGLFRPVSSQ